MSLEKEVRAIRLGVSLFEDKQRLCFRISGPDANDALERICPRELFIRDGQMLHTLLLNENGNPIADLYVCSDGEDFLLLVDGLTFVELSDFLSVQISAGAKVEISDLTADHVLFSLNGPYAWELLSELISPEVVGLPYLGFYRGDDFICFRAGMTGEYAYYLLIHRDIAPDWHTRILKLGADFDLEIVGPKALDLCALENFCFNIRHDVIPEVTPLELQLQGRISFKKSYSGSQALLKRRGERRRRAVLASSPNEFRNGDSILDEDRVIGSVIQADFSIYRKEWLGLILLDLAYAYTGVEVACRSPELKETQLRILTAPAINNRSLYVDPQRHNYSTRDRDSFPALILSLPA